MSAISHSVWSAEVNQNAKTGTTSSPVSALKAGRAAGSTKFALVRAFVRVYGGLLSVGELLRSGRCLQPFFGLARVCVCVFPISLLNSAI